MTYPNVRLGVECHLGYHQDHIHLQTYFRFKHIENNVYILGNDVADL